MAMPNINEWFSLVDPYLPYINRGLMDHSGPMNKKEKELSSRFI